MKTKAQTIDKFLTTILESTLLDGYLLKEHDLSIRDTLAVSEVLRSKKEVVSLLALLSPVIDFESGFSPKLVLFV